MATSEKTLKVQTIVLVVFPWILGGFFLWTSPTYRELAGSPEGVAALIGMIIWQAAGVLSIRKLIRPEDRLAQLKLIGIMVVFFFPVVFL